MTTKAFLKNINNKYTVDAILEQFVHEYMLKQNILLV